MESLSGSTPLPVLPPYPANLRVNADDFGISPGVSRAVFECARNGLVNSISACPPRDAESRELLGRLIGELPHITVGCHLTLFDAPPVLSGTPRFLPGPEKSAYAGFIRMYLSGRFPAEAVYREWKAQIEKLLEAGVRVAHLDSHQHLHLLPGLWSCAVHLKREFGLQHLRVPYEPSLGGFVKGFPAGLGLQLLSWLKLRERKGKRFFGFETSTEFSFERYRFLPDAVRKNPGIRFELMVHPGHHKGGKSEMDELEKLHRQFQG